MICVVDFHDLCPQQSPQLCCRHCRKVGIMEFGLNQAAGKYVCKLTKAIILIHIHTESQLWFTYTA